VRHARRSARDSITADSDRGGRDSPDRREDPGFHPLRVRRIHPLNRSRRYVRLVVDRQDNPRFDLDAFPQIHEFSHGIPRRINTLCDRVLLAAYLAETHRITATEVNGVAAEIRDELDGAAPRAEVPKQAVAPAPVGGVAPSELRQELAALANRVAALEGANAMLRSLLVDVMARSTAPRPSDAEAGS
jgi:hypothetical protein